MFNNLLAEIYRSCVGTTNDQVQSNISWLCASAAVARALRILARLWLRDVIFAFFFPNKPKPYFEVSNVP